MGPKGEFWGCSGYDRNDPNSCKKTMPAARGSMPQQSPVKTQPQATVSKSGGGADMMLLSYIKDIVCKEMEFNKVEDPYKQLVEKYKLVKSQI